MRKAVIPTIGKIFFCLIPVVMFGMGCTHQRQYGFKPVGMPEEIYLNTAIETSYTPNIVVFAFRSKGYPNQVGEKASRLLYSELLKRDIKADVTFTPSAGAADMDALARFATENKYDYIITGDVLYFLNGAISTNSRVEEEIKIYGVSGKRLQMIGYAKAVETARPLPSTDFLVMEGRGASAPSAEILLKRNAEKFSRLLSSMFSESGATKR